MPAGRGRVTSAAALEPAADSPTQAVLVAVAA